MFVYNTIFICLLLCDHCLQTTIKIGDMTRAIEQRAVAHSSIQQYNNTTMTDVTFRSG